jgi:hypothetical protein
MPILTETTHPRKRRTPVWLLILALVVLPLVGLFAWSWYQPVRFLYGLRGVGFGRVTIPIGLNPPWVLQSDYAWVGIKLPEKRGNEWYAASWVWK